VRKTFVAFTTCVKPQQESDVDLNSQEKNVLPCFFIGTWQVRDMLSFLYSVTYNGDDYLDSIICLILIFSDYEVKFKTS